VHERDRWVWRAALEDSHTGERHGFADLQRPFTFLEQQTSAESLASVQTNEQDGA